MRHHWLALALATVVFSAAACTDDHTTAPADLSPGARQGFEVAGTNGCFACHGDGGVGGVAPALVGLAGTTVTLADGSTVVADEAYLRRSIIDPAAQTLPGLSIAMPVPTLAADQVDAIVAWMLETSGG